jgi:hypothetical protein
MWRLRHVLVAASLAGIARDFGHTINELRKL